MDDADHTGGDPILALLLKAMRLNEELAAKEMAKGSKADPRKAAKLMLEAAAIGKDIADVMDRRGLAPKPVPKSIQVEFVRSRHEPQLDELEVQLAAAKAEIDRLRRQQQQPTGIQPPLIIEGTALPASATDSASPQRSAAPSTAPAGESFDQKISRIRQRKESVEARYAPHLTSTAYPVSAEVDPNRGLLCGQGWRRFDHPGTSG